MRIETPAGNPQFRTLSAWLQARPAVRWLPLRRYIGEFEADSRDAAAFDVVELRRTDQPEFEPAIDVYRHAFDSPSTAVAAGSFVRGLSRYADTDYRYHLWAVSSRHAGGVVGMASFFGFRGMGFGGYLVLEGAFRGVGALRPLLARMEQQLVVDALGIEGWLIECETHSTATVFARCGFHALAVPYAQAALPGAARADSPALILMYRPLGRTYGPPQLATERLLLGLQEMLRWVYRIEQPGSHPTVLAVAAALRDRVTVPMV
jgi:hypothetical protein